MREKDNPGISHLKAIEACKPRLVHETDHLGGGVDALFNLTAPGHRPFSKKIKKIGIVGKARAAVLGERRSKRRGC